MVVLKELEQTFGETNPGDNIFVTPPEERFVRGFNRSMFDRETTDFNVIRGNHLNLST